MYRQASLCVVAATALAFLSGCASIDAHNRVADWPELKVVEYHVSHQEMRERCQRFAQPGTYALGCTEFHFAFREAHIYVSKDFPLRYVLEHERLHAAGYDHAGSDAMQLMWEDWKARNRIRGRSPNSVEPDYR